MLPFIFVGNICNHVPVDKWNLLYTVTGWKYFLDRCHNGLRLFVLCCRPQQDIARRSCPPRIDLDAMRSTHSQRRCMHKLLKQHRIRCYMENVLKQTKRIKHAISHVFASCTRPKVKDEPIFNYDNVRSELRKNIENLIREIPVKELIQGEEMGSGANGSVGKCSFSYHAEHVAVKRIMIGDWGTVRDFIREVNLMARAASHENYPRLLGWAIDDSESGITGMIIMECFDHHLEHYFVRILNSEVPTPSMFQRIHLMIDYATALHYLHDAQNFVHGDVHLRNLMIKYGGSRVRGFVVDLGLSR